MSGKLPLPSTRDSRSFLTPSKRDDPLKSPAVKVIPNKKYAHVHSKVSTFWSPREMERAGLKKFFVRKGTSSASTSASSSIANSPDGLNRTIDLGQRSLNYQISGPDFAARLNDLKNTIHPISEAKSSNESTKDN